MIRKNINLTVHKCYRSVFGSARFWECSCDGLEGTYVIRGTRDRYDIFLDVDSDWLESMKNMYNLDITDEDSYKTFKVGYEGYTDEDGRYKEVDLMFLSGLMKDGKTIIIYRNDEIEKMWGKIYSNQIIKIINKIV